MKENKKGFTLIELLVVVLIIGVLAGIALPQYRKAVGKAELAQVIAATKVIQNAQERHYLVQGAYTNNLENLDIDWNNNSVSCTITRNYSTCYNKNYLIHHFYRETYVPSWIECYAKNKTLANACEELVGKEAGEVERDGCRKITSGSVCYEVGGVYIPM